MRRQTDTQNQSAALILFALAGMVCLFLSAYFGFKTHRFVGVARKTQGTVVEVVKRLDRQPASNGQRERWMYFPIVEFISPLGKTVRFQSKVSSSSPAFRVGEIIPVLYNPAQPTEAEIDSFWRIWFAPVVLFTLAGGLLVIPMFGYLRLNNFKKSMH